MNLVRYKRLFVNRSDVFAEQLQSGAYSPIRRDITDDDIAEHLAGMWSIGTYVIDPTPEGQWVKYVTFDLDSLDERLLKALQRCVEGALNGGTPRGIADEYKPLLCEFSGNKGWHVWLFLDEPLPAARVRRWLERDFWPQWRADTEDFTLEVFPKQDEVSIGGFGNLVKLPFGVHAVSGARSEIVVVQGWANSIDDVVPFPSELVPDIATAPTASRRDGRPSTGQPSSPFPCVDQILNSGAGRGQRNNAMFHLAVYWFGHAVPHDVAVELCLRANENFDPPMPEYEVTKTVDQAYAGRYHSAKCGNDWLRDFCEGPCKGGWTVKAAEEPEGGSLKRAQEGQAVEVQVVRRTTDGGRTRLTIRHPDAQNEPTLVVG